jgi:tripartite-type tricarboxylate transporter receptor subunit TctC
MRACLTRFAVIALAALFVTAAAAQYPVRPVRMIVSIPPGGAPDIAARVLGQKLADSLGQQVVIDNRAGSNGNIAADLVAKSIPDGYTLGLFADSLIAINPHLYTKMPINTLKDLAPVATVASNQFVLSVNPALPVKTFQEFIDHARKSTPPLAYASGGNGSQHQMCMELLKQRAGINLVHVPYKGGVPATTATVAGETMAMFAGTSSAPQIRAGRLRALAVTGAQRASVFPELPTIAEFYPGYEVTIWLALFAPPGMPPTLMAQLRREVNKALAAADVKEKLNAAGGLEPHVTTPEAFAALIRRDYEKYGKVVREVGVKVD